jgi:hypothetical protein
MLGMEGRKKRIKERIAEKRKIGQKKARKQGRNE